MKFFILFIILPIIEIIIFINVGDLIGVFYTILLILLTGVVGLYLIKNHSLRNLIKLSRNPISKDNSFEKLSITLIIVVSGLLLIFPGFLTDIIGLTLLIPKIRNTILTRIIKKTSKSNKNDDIIIDAEYFEEEKDKQ